MSRRLFTGVIILTCYLPACSSGREHSRISKPERLSLLGRPLHAESRTADRSQLEDNLALAHRQLAENPDDSARIVWVGRRLGYLGRLQEAIRVYTDGIAKHPKYAPLYRHRGHRYISVRQFDNAIDDLEVAAVLIEGKPDEIEPDGVPNSRNIPLTTTAFNVWYHLGLARYLKGDHEGALAAYRETMKYTQGYDDNIVAVTDWMYMTLRRLDRDEEATALLDRITPDMEIIENDAYYRRCLMYKGWIKPSELLDVENASGLDLATLGYGLGNWHLDYGDETKAIETFKWLISGNSRSAFGFIAAETDLARMKARHIEGG